MLSKSKSKQINLAKYLLVFPMVISMLFYTSAIAQEDVEENQKSNLIEQELYEKMDYEFENLNNNEVLKKIFSNLSINRENYLLNKEEYVKMKIGFEKLHLKVLEKYKSDNNVEGINKVNKRLIEIREETYGDYLLRKKTQKAIDNWENSGYNGVLKKLVGDLDYITAAEQKIIDSKIKQIKSDNWFHTLVISDGLRHKKLEFKEEQKIIEISSNRKNKKEVSFAIIDESPKYPGCESLTSNNELKKCFSNNITKFVARNFDTSVGKANGLKGAQKINVFFTINKEGKIENLKMRTPHLVLEKETRRVINLLPKFIPGKQDGKTVNVTFFLPITFLVKGDDDVKANILEQNNLNKEDLKEPIAFPMVKQVPIFPGCEESKKRDEAKQCFIEKTDAFIKQNLNFDKAKSLGFTGDQKILAFFTIGEDGFAKQIHTKAGNVELDKELKRVIGLLPKMIPGKHNGKNVDVNYYLPVKFKL